MEARAPRALLVGENPQGRSNLAKRLQERGFQCQFASSSQQALSLARVCDFDLVLSPIRLHGTSLLSLMDLFAGSGVTLFYFHGVEEGCWWLPAIRHGKRCFGSSAFRPSEFVSALDAAIDEVS
jgi:DNA-binding NtrC family response regulator